MSELIESLTAQLTDYHHMEQLVDGKMAENQRLRKINEKLQSQLAASQRREQAAVDDIWVVSLRTPCTVCAHGFANTGAPCTVRPCKFEWRGPQEAEKGEA